MSLKPDGSPLYSHERECRSSGGGDTLLQVIFLTVYCWWTVLNRFFLKVHSVLTG